MKKNMPLIVNGLPGTGMAPFGSWVSEDEAKLIQKYILARAGGEMAGK